MRTIRYEVSEMLGWSRLWAVDSARSPLRSHSATSHSIVFCHARSTLRSAPPDLRPAPLRFPLRSRFAHMLCCRVLLSLSLYVVDCGVEPTVVEGIRSRVGSILLRVIDCRRFWNEKWLCPALLEVDINRIKS